jgi:hypothetical protein
MNVSLLFRGVNAQLPRESLGWDTGTVEILSPISLSINSTESDFRAQAKNIMLSTTDSTERIPASAGNVKDGSVTWKIDQVRLPVYSRYASSLTFEIGASSSLVGSRKPDALAVLWLQDLVDDEEKDIEIPVVVGKDLRQLRQNVLNDFTAKTHEYRVVGHIRTRVKLDSGLDEVCIVVVDSTYAVLTPNSFFAGP